MNLSPEITQTQESLLMASLIANGAHDGSKIVSKRVFLAPYALQRIGLHLGKQPRACLPRGVVLHEGLCLVAFRACTQGVRGRDVPTKSLLLEIS